MEILRWQDKSISTLTKKFKTDLKKAEETAAAAIAEAEAAAKAKATLSPAEMKAKQQAQARSAQEAEEQADLEIAMDLMGGGGGGGDVGGGDMVDVVLFEAMEPENRKGFDAMSQAILDKACKYNDKPFWKDFVIGTTKGFAADMKPEDIGKIASALQVLKTEKNKAMMGKKKKKGAHKAQLGGGGGNKGFGQTDMTNYGSVGGDYDDFM